MFDFTALIQALIGLCATAVTVYVIPWIKSKTTENQRAHVMKIVKMLVEAAEQLAENNGWDGKAKLVYVKQELERRNITFDLQAIESMVYELRFREREISFIVDGEIEGEFDEPPGK